MERCGSRPGASRSAMRMTPPRLGWTPAWAMTSEARTSTLRTTAARNRRDGKGARRAMARSPVLEFVVIDRETGAKRAEKDGHFRPGGERLSMLGIVILCTGLATCRTELAALGARDRLADMSRLAPTV